MYKSIKSEVNTAELIKYSLNMGKIIALLKVEENELKFYKINSISENLEKSKFGIEESSVKKQNLVDNNIIDLVIVPGICFDEPILEKVPTDNNDVQVKK